MTPLERPFGKPIRCEECRGTGYAEPAPGFTFGNDCPVCKGQGWLSVRSTTRLWLWRNGDHFLAFDNPMPCQPGGGDPLVLGEPAAIAELMPSTPGWEAWDESGKRLPKSPT